MNADQLMDALGEIDLAMLEECEAYTAERARRRRQLRYLASGICAVLAIGIGVRMLPIFGRMTSDSAAAENIKDEAEISVTATLSTQAEVSEQEKYQYSSTQDVHEYLEDTYGGAGVPLETVDDVLRDACEVDVPAVEAPMDDAPIEESADVPASEGDSAFDQYQDKTLSEEESVLELPMLNPNFAPGGFGFEGILLYEEDVYSSVNLLDIYGTPETLPVYKNLAFYDMSGKPVYLSDDEMIAMGNGYAQTLGFDVLSCETAYSWEDEDIEDYVTMQTSGGEIRVEGNGDTTIVFASPIPLPAGLSLGRDTDAHTALQTAAYLTESYKALLSDADYEVFTKVFRSYLGEQHRSVHAYPIGDSAAEAYVNRNFSEVTFYGGDGDAAATLGMIRIANRRLSAEEIGQYPLISEEEAMERLAAGEYITTVPAEYLAEDGITEDMILSCELEYRVSNIDKFSMPYYHYYVRLDRFPALDVEGLKHYGGYWVPAVHPDYLDPDTVWDGRFN